MIIWFAVLAVGGVLAVFRDPRLDHRLVALGALVPDAVDLALRQGRSGPAHTLLGAVGALTVTMPATVGRRALRKRLLAIPIGWLAHLVLDPAWTATAVFWWPAFGWHLPGDIPLVARPVGVTAAMEVVGVAVAVALWRRCGLEDRETRSRFARTGALELRPVSRPAVRSGRRR